MARTRIERLCLAACLVLTASGFLLAVEPQQSQASLSPVGGTLKPALLVEPEAAPPQARWSAIARPIEAFGLSAPHIAAAPAYEADRQIGGEGRRDTIRIGSLDEAEAFVAVTVHRRPDIVPTLAETAGRLTANRAGPLGRAEAMTSKFGEMASAELIAADRFDSRGCIVFDRYEAKAQVALDGIVCAASGKRIDRRAAACIVDRLDLIGGKSDGDLRRYFAQAEARRDFCGVGDLRASGTGRAFVDGGSTIPVRRSAGR